MPDCREQELFQRARAGERAAFDRLQEELGPPIRRFVRRLIGPSDSEDDIVQNSFLALYMNLERLDPVKNLRPFLFRIVRNLCYDELRQKGRFQWVSPSEESGEPDGPLPPFIDRRPQPDEAVHWMLLYAEVQKAIDRLPELQRQTLILYCEEDLSYKHVAEAMATDIGTVKSRLHYARRNLVNMLTPEMLEMLGITQGGQRYER